MPETLLALLPSLLWKAPTRRRFPSGIAMPHSKTRPRLLTGPLTQQFDNLGSGFKILKRLRQAQSQPFPKRHRDAALQN